MHVQKIDGERFEIQTAGDAVRLLLDLAPHPAEVYLMYDLPKSEAATLYCAGRLDLKHAERIYRFADDSSDGIRDLICKTFRRFIDETAYPLVLVRKGGPENAYSPICDAVYVHVRLVTEKNRQDAQRALYEARKSRQYAHCQVTLFDLGGSP